MKRVVVLIPIFVLLVFSCVFMENIVGSGDMVEVDLGYTGFNSLDIRSAFDVTLIQNDSYSATVMVDDNVIDKVVSYRDGKTLTIGLDDAYRYAEVSLRAVITMPTLTGVELSDAASVTVIDSASFPSVTNFRAKLSGASRLLLPSIVADTLSVKLTEASRANIGASTSDTTVTAKGASSIQMNGSSYDLSLTAEDASVVTLKEYRTNGASVNLSDASEAWVHVNGVLNINLSGASFLYYRGAVDIGTLILVEASSIDEYSN
jgi:hypothetical protein